MLSDPGSMAFVYKDMRVRFNITIRSTFLSKWYFQRFDKRFVPVHDTVVRALERYLALRQRVFPSHDHVFVGANLDPLNACTAWRTFRQLVRASGIDRSPGQRFLTVHSLRHTFAVRTLEQSLAESGNGTTPDLPVLSTYLGHANVSSTLQHTPALMRTIADRAELLYLNGDSS